MSQPAHEPYEYGEGEYGEGEYGAGPDANPNGPYPDIHGDRRLRTPEWEKLQLSGTGEPGGILNVEWDPVTDTVRVSGPVVVNNPHHAPAP